MPAAVVGLDLGTSSVKALATTPGGEELASGAIRYGIATPAPGRVEQDAAALCDAASAVLARVAAEARARGARVAAVGLSAAMHGLLAVDAAGTPLGPLVTWMDRRAEDVADRWRADGTAAALYAATGAPMHPMLPVAKLRHLAERDPGAFAAARRFVGLKELLVFRWTGAWRVDHGIASATGLFGLRTRDWDPAALACAGVGPDRLSTPAPPSTALPFLPDAARALGLEPETRLVLGSSDGALATIGVGAAGREAALTLGTSGAIRVLTDLPLLDPERRTFCYCADDARYVAGGPTSGAGAALDWLLALLVDELPQPERFARAAALAAEAPPGAAGVVVLPFLAGERAPWWNGALRGAIEGLDLAHDRRALLRGAFEGIVFGVRAVYEVLRALAGDAERLLLTGGLTAAPFVRALVADAFGIPAARSRREEAAALGAALVAAQALVLGGDASDAARAIGREPASIPDPSLRAAYEAAFAAYRDAVLAALARLGAPRP